MVLTPNGKFGLCHYCIQCATENERKGILMNKDVIAERLPRQRRLNLPNYTVLDFCLWG